MKIKDVFQLEIGRRIPAVAKVDDVDPATIEQELREYVVTTPIETALIDLLESYAESRTQKTDKVGVWISGFFGSGKSHFAKILSYLLRNPAVGAKHAIDIFKSRLDGQSEATAPIQQQLHRLQQIDSRVVMFNIEAMKRSNSIAETMYSQYLAQERGLSANLVVGRLELSLLRRNLYDRFKQSVSQEVGEAWERVRDDFTMVRAAAANALARLDKKLYPDAKSAEKAFDDLNAQGAPSISEMARELADYVDELQAAGSGERPPHLVFVVDEIGQFVGREKSRLLELQTIAEEFAIHGRGKLWLIVTSQQELKAIVADIGAMQDEFGRIITRFDMRLSLTSEDVERVLEDRILKKNKKGAESLSKFYEHSGGALSTIGQLPGASRDLPSVTADNFLLNYPFLPYQFTLIQDIFQAARTGVTTGFTLNTEARSMLGMCQGVIVRNLLEGEVGQLVSLDLVFDQVVLDLNQADVREINKVVEQLPEAMSLDTQLVKALYFIQQIPYLACTPDALAHALIRDAGRESIGELRKQVLASLERLATAGFVVEKEAGVYEFLTGAKKGFEEEVNAVKVKKNDQRRIVRDRLAEVLREVGQVDYEKKQRFGVAVYADGEKLNKEADALILQVYSPLHLKLEEGLSAETVELESFSRPNTVYWLGKPDEELERLVTRLFKLKEAITARQARPGKSEEDKALLREKSNELDTLNRTVESHLRSALFNGTLIWNGNVEELDGKTTTLNPIFNRIMSQVVPHVYLRFDLAAVRPDKDAIEVILTMPDHALNTVQPGLNLFDQKNHLNTHSPSIEEILRELERRENKGLDRDGKSLLDYFTAPPYGWHPEVIRLLLAAIFRGGMLTVKSGNVTYDDASVPAARDKLIKANDFKNAVFIYESGEVISLPERQQAQAKLFAMFGRANTQDTAAVLAEHITADVKTLGDRVDRLALQLRQEEYPLPPSFKQARDVVSRVTSQTRPNKVVRLFLDTHATLQQLHADAEALYRFVELDKRLPLYRRARALLHAYEATHHVYSAAALREPTVVTQAEAVQAGLKGGAVGEAWPPFEKAYQSLLNGFKATYDEVHRQRDELYARLRTELEAEGLQVEHFRTYECGGLAFDVDRVNCAACGQSFNLLAEQLLSMPVAAKRLRETQRQARASQTDKPPRKVKQVSVSTLLAGKEIEDEAGLDKALNIVKDAALKALNDSDAIELI